MPPRRSTTLHPAASEDPGNQDSYIKEEDLEEYNEFDDENYKGEDYEDPTDQSNNEEQNENQKEGQNEGHNQERNPMNKFPNLLRQNINLHHNQQPSPAPRNAVAKSFRAFKSLRPPEFQGTASPVEARAWLKEMEKSFEIIQVEDGQKTIFATYLLKG